MTEAEELIFPQSLAETKVAISELIGEVTELRTWLNLQYQGRNNGLRVDWQEIKAAQEDIARLQGDINALKKHASGFREDESAALIIAKAEKQRIKSENISRQAAMQREAMALKNDKRVLNAEMNARQHEAASRAVLAYIAQNAPEHFSAAKAASVAARMATK